MMAGLYRQWMADSYTINIRTRLITSRDTPLKLFVYSDSNVPTHPVLSYNHRITFEESVEIFPQEWNLQQQQRLSYSRFYRIKYDKGREVEFC